MNAATKITDEIGSLLELSNTFLERYNKLPHTIELDLYEELFYFQSRVKYILESVNKKELRGFLVRFQTAHLNSSLSKSQIDPLNDDLLFVRTYLKTLKKELENGLLFNISDLIRAEIFSDFLESGKYLLDEGWKDAAAVMIGGVLEDKLRDLSSKNNQPLQDAKGKNLSIDPMNINLSKAGIYKLGTQKLITAYAHIRNNAAHSKYDEYTEAQVIEMYNFVLRFNIEH